MKKLFFAAVFAFLFAASLSAYAEANKSEIYDLYGDGYHYKTAESFSSGSGSADDPYIITSWEEFNLMGTTGCGDEGIGRHFKLACDLKTADGSLSWSGHVTWQPVFNDAIGSETNPFQGIFDGGNYEIQTSPLPYLFDTVGERGIVRNICKNRLGIVGKNYGLIEKCRIETQIKTEYGDNAGGIAGENMGTIRKCFVSHTASFRNGISYQLVSYGSGIGGICGFNNGGLIEECYAGLCVQGKSGARAVGGIAGDNTGGIIRNCMSGGVCGIVINAGKETGGIVGKLNCGTVENCISLLYPQGSQDLAGGAVGAAYGDYKIENCYYRGLECGSSTIENAKYSSQVIDEVVQKCLSENNLDFKNVWASNNIDYPVLRSLCLYSDCAEHWARDTIEEMASKKEISGYEDGSFRPDNTVTKAEYIVMVNSKNAWNDPDKEIPYTDVPDWAIPYVRSGWHTHLIDEHIEVSPEELGANNPITRLEAAVLAGKKISNWASEELEFTDSGEIPEWAVKPLRNAVKKRCINGYEDGSFRPYNTLTRAEAAVIINKINN